MTSSGDFRSYDLSDGNAAVLSDPAAVEGGSLYAGLRDGVRVWRLDGCGAVATALVNAAWSRGLGAVINSQGIMQSPVVREHAGIADDQVIMKSIAIGWPDDSFPANAVVSERKTVQEAVVFRGFDQ